MFSAAAGIAFPRFIPSTMTTAFFKPPDLFTINSWDSRAPVPHTLGSLFSGRGGSFGIEPETVIDPEIVPPSVTWMASYPATGETAAGTGGAGGASVLGRSFSLRPQPTISTSVTPPKSKEGLAFIQHLRMMWNRHDLLDSLPTQDRS